MKHFFALLLSALMVLSLLTACGDKTTPSDGCLLYTSTSPRDTR